MRRMEPSPQARPQPPRESPKSFAPVAAQKASTFVPGVMRASAKATAKSPRINQPWRSTSSRSSAAMVGIPPPKVEFPMRRKVRPTRPSVGSSTLSFSRISRLHDDALADRVVRIPHDHVALRQSRVDLDLGAVVPS